MISLILWLWLVTQEVVPLMRLPILDDELWLFGYELSGSPLVVFIKLVNWSRLAVFQLSRIRNGLLGLQSFKHRRILLFFRYGRTSTHLLEFERWNQDFVLRSQTFSSIWFGVLRWQNQVDDLVLCTMRGIAEIRWTQWYWRSWCCLSLRGVLLLLNFRCLFDKILRFKYDWGHVII